jgi:hypothetical protein
MVSDNSGTKKMQYTAYMQPKILARIPDWLVAGLGYFLIIATLWLPVGVNSTGLLEEWRAKAYLDGSYNSVGAYGIPVSSDLQARPTSIIPVYISYLITPDNFVGSHIVAIAILWTKSLLVYLILKTLLPHHLLPAFFIGAIYTIYPADTAVVSLRVLHYHAQIALFLLAVYLLLQHWQNPHWGKVLLIWLALLSGMLITESVYPFVFVTPALLLFQNPKITGRFIRVSFLWYLIPLLTFSYSYYSLFVTDVSWQNEVVQVRTPQFYLDTILRVYYVNLVGGWRIAQANTRLLAGFAEFAAMSVSMVASLLCGTWFAVYQDKSQKLSPIRLSVILVGSLMLIAVGFSIFLVTDRAESTFRVFLLSSLGAAMFWGYLLFALSYTLLTKYWRIVYVLGMTFLVCIAAVRHIYVQYTYAEQSAQEGQFLRQVTQQAPALQHPTFILFLPSNESYNYLPTDFTSSAVLSSALQYIYADYENIQGVFFCSAYWGQCRLGDNGVSILESVGNETTIDYNALVIFAVDNEGIVQLRDSIAESDDYNPMNHIDSQAIPPYRISMFDVP